MEMKQTIKTLIKVAQEQHDKQDYDKVIETNKVIYNLKNMIGEDTSELFSYANERYADSCPWLRMWSE